MKPRTLIWQYCATQSNTNLYYKNPSKMKLITLIPVKALIEATELSEVETYIHNKLAHTGGLTYSWIDEDDIDEDVVLTGNGEVLASKEVMAAFEVKDRVMHPMDINLLEMIASYELEAGDYQVIDNMVTPLTSQV